MAKKYITCEINKVFEAKGGKFGMSLKPLEDNSDIQNSNSYKAQYDNFTMNYFLNGEDIPNWAKQGNKIKFCYFVNNGWINCSQEDGVELADDLDDDVSFDVEKIEKETKPETFGQIEIQVLDYIAKYRTCLKAINEDEFLGKLDNGLKKYIATSFFIQLNR